LILYSSHIEGTSILRMFPPNLAPIACKPANNPRT
jgi:hypothetical protein